MRAVPTPDSHGGGCALPPQLFARRRRPPRQRRCTWSRGRRVRPRQPVSSASLLFSSGGRCAAVNDDALVVKESQYSLHVICGVNELVSGPKFCSNFLAHLPFKYQYSHINFLATLDAQPPKLFFAECNCDDHNDTWCVPVDWSRPVGGQARCFYCESHGNRIIHPALSVFHGFDFEEAFFGPDTKSFYDNDQIIFFKSAFVDWVNGVEEEAIYNNYRLRDDDDGNNGLDSKRLQL